MNEIKLPITVKRAIELLGLFLLGALVYLGRDIITPLLLAFFLSIILLPVYRWLRKKKIPDTLAIVLSLAILFVMVILIIWFFSFQISMLVADFPMIRSNIEEHLFNISYWINSISGLSAQAQLEMINEYSERLLALAGQFLSGAAGSVTGIFIFLGLLPIYIFLMLFYKNLLIKFVFLWFQDDEHVRVRDIMKSSESIIKSYIGGLFIQVIYVTVLLSLILAIMGIKHAILIGALFALLNLIPYVGALVGIILAVLLTLASTSEVWPIFAVLGAIAFVQFIDNNILMPRIVGGKVKINALATIVGVIIGGALAGITGMFLSLPVLAVLKVIFDRTDHMKHWGVLLGDERPKLELNHPELITTSSNTMEAKEDDEKI